MSWKAFSDLMWGISDLCLTLYDHLPEQRERHVPAVVASGRVRNMAWVAVHPSQARAFKAACPNAHKLETFYKVWKSWEYRNPEGYRYLIPFAQALVEAIELHDGCEFFVIGVGG